MPRRTVITIGAAVVDAFIWSRAFSTVRSPKFVGGVGECLSLGAKINIDRFVLSTGGGATNAAATFAHMGHTVRCVAAIGDDVFGAAVLDDFSSRHIDASCLVPLKNHQTGFSVILVMPSGERTILTHRGASEFLPPKHIPWNKVSGDWLYMTSLAGRLDVLKAALNHAARKKMRVFWNPGSKDIAHGPLKLKPYLRRIDILDVNREEAAALTRKPLGDLRGMFRDAHKLVPAFLLTDGSRGAYWSDGEKLLFAKPTGAKAVNRTGAGDAFGSGFLAAWMVEADPAYAMQVGTLNAEGVIRQIGAKTGLLPHMPSRRQAQKIRILTVRD